MRPKVDQETCYSLLLGLLPAWPAVYGRLRRGLRTSKRIQTVAWLLLCLEPLLRFIKRLLVTQATLQELAQHCFVLLVLREVQVTFFIPSSTGDFVHSLNYFKQLSN